MHEHDPVCEGLDDEKVLADVEEYGWHVVKIVETNDAPGWAFSIGLYRKFNHPEVVVFGLTTELSHSLINTIGENVRAGKIFKIDAEYPDLIDAYNCIIKPVNSIWYKHFLGYANWFYKSENYPALQCIWPDRNGRYPGEPEFNPNWLWAQPLLFHEDPATARTVELLKSMEPRNSASDWPFDQAPDVAAITTVRVLERKLPILTVTHYSDDHSWAFVCGTTNRSADCRVVGMHEALSLDPTIRTIADLPPGWTAWREYVGGKWHREQDDESE
jgi:hypothetical protein